jgi:hypothetical protein
MFLTQRMHSPISLESDRNLVMHSLMSVESDRNPFQLEAFVSERRIRRLMHEAVLVTLHITRLVTVIRGRKLTRKGAAFGP